MQSFSLRDFLDLLAREGPDEYRQVKKEVDTRFELSGILAKLESRALYPVVFFNKVRGHRMPVVSNLFASRKKIALALQCTEDSLNETYRLRETNRIEPVLVGDGPVKEVVFKGDQVDLSLLPIVVHNEKDAGPYITAGAGVVKDPETGIRNIGMYRHMLVGKNQIAVHLAETSHSNFVFHKHVQLNRPMEVAITIGMHPALYLGVLSFVSYGVDEYTIVGGLMEQPLQLIKCETVDLEVPAMAEIVIEGLIHPNKNIPEGPFGEYTSLYGKKALNPVIDVTAVTMRKNPIYLDVFSGHLDHQLLGGTPRLSSIYKGVQTACPSVKDVFMPPSGCCRLTCNISIEKRHEGEAKNVACAAFAVDPFIKYVIVVDSDVDIFSDSSVWNAIATRVRAGEDVFMIRNAKGHPLDPTARQGFLVDKVCIDATRPLQDYPETISVPGISELNLDDYFE